ncbi:Polynucleotide adenylyltransferase region [Thermoanaerobacter mathranii subsp. mathranii str. A3]|uniref:Polynucleotide adenylyltransferase region n=2 Tax=Thermoanaerobacter TaxID=1754 RepID=D3T8V2_THEIA|nr:Polynucleotide adenylyltransferase region [Thermoanaerobacter italicus Ab9]ADH60890.1 Polynucleotide adenylyltransferase region [Thermoanaerobacter mathranii subsp. mathranii str. A3]
MRILVNGIDLIRLLKEISLKTKIKSYIVGGVVRDFLLGVKNLDIDVVVEGDGIEFAYILLSYLKGDIVVYEAFRTATLSYHNFSIDIISARKEYYECPAALPTIEFSNIYDDMARRDFTINALAYDVMEGKILDYFNGLEDLKKGVIRVLHSKSFIDDPTRIFRAIRYATRYSFEIEEKTHNLMKESIENIRLLSADRIRNELLLVLKEDKAKEMIEKIISYGIDKVIFDEITLNTQNLDTVYTNIEVELYRFLVLFYYLKEEDINEIEKKLRINKIYFKALKDLFFLREQLNCQNKNIRKIRETIDKTKEEVLRAIEVMEGEKAEKIIKGKLTVRGKDIKNLGLPPSPLYGELLDKVFEAKINGIITTGEEEIEFLKRLIEKLKKGE